MEVRSADVSNRWNDWNGWNEWNCPGLQPSCRNFNARHAGQIEYLHGLVKHQGWFPAVEK